MAGLLFLKISSSNVGEFIGPSTQQGFENQIPLISTFHQVESSVGTRTISRNVSIHHPFSITKLVDQSSPLFYGAWYMNVKITSFKVSYLKPNPMGELAVVYTVELFDAKIVKIEQTLASPNLAQPIEAEKIAFTYQRMLIRHANGGIEQEIKNNQGLV